MKTFFKKFGEAISIVIVVAFLILASPYIITGLIIFTIINYLKYKRTKYYVDTKDKYTWLCTTSAYINFYNDVKKVDLPVEFYRDKKVKLTGYGYFVYKDILILCDYALNMIYFDYGQDEWYIYEEHGDIQLKEMVEEEIKKANEFFGENRCNKAIVFVDGESLDEALKKNYENIEFLRDTNKISELINFISREKGVPLINEIAEALYDKQLAFTDYEVVEVIYSSDKTKRFIILKSTNGFYKYTYEEICVLDEDEWKYCCNDDNAYPAFWETRDKSSATSFFGTENEAFLSMKQESEYILHFDGERNMKIIEKDDWKFSVDIEKTKEYYKKLSLCDCGECRNYYLQVEEMLPKLKEFLEEFGVDISKPDEISSFTYENEIDYSTVYYTVCGEIIEDSKYEIDIYENLFLSIVVNDEFAPPNEQTGQYFTFSVFQIRLPWVLDEPFPDTRKISKKKKVATQERFFDKFHGIFKKITRS